MQMKRRHAQYKRYYDAKFNIQPKFVLTKRVIVDKHPSSGKVNTVKRMEGGSYNKLQAQKAGPFQNIKGQPNTVMIDEKGVPNAVPKQKFTAPTNLREYRSESWQTTNSPENNMHITQQQQEEKTSVSVSDPPTSLR